MLKVEVVVEDGGAGAGETIPEVRNVKHPEHDPRVVGDSNSLQPSSLRSRLTKYSRIRFALQELLSAGCDAHLFLKSSRCQRRPSCLRDENRPGPPQIYICRLPEASCKGAGLLLDEAFGLRA